VINRKELIGKHNPVLKTMDTDSPLTVGNGEFCFTADITGLQTLYDEYQAFPLCTMSEWGWNTKPNLAGGFYTFDDVEKTYYSIDGRNYEYAVDCQAENEEVYNWLRHNPHRRNLARVALLWDGREISSTDITNIRQELDLFTGVLHSDFTLNGYDIKVRTCCAKSADVLGFSIMSKAPAGHLSVRISLPDSSHRKNGSDWDRARHYYTDEMAKMNNECYLLGDEAGLGVPVALSDATGLGASVAPGANNACYFIKFTGSEFEFTLAFSPTAFPIASVEGMKNKSNFERLITDNANSINNTCYFKQVLTDSATGWKSFWTKCGLIDFSKCKDPRAFELERRAILSQYLIAIQSTGNLPPAETGLSCNSWYGKFHLEMHIIHSGWLALYGHSDLLEKSFSWYVSILDKARSNAGRNAYKGARWPKMVGPEGTDSPSFIATLLIWQQPHLLYMLELTMLVNLNKLDFKRKYWFLVKETADFMVDFLRFNDETGYYDLTAPLIPAQEEHPPETVLNPVFELCYWHFGLEIAINWAKELNENYSLWQDVYEKLALPPVIDNLYPAHANCVDTFSKFNRDHPSMLYGYGFIPCELIEEDKMRTTAELVGQVWDKQSLWGWDFAFIAMTYARLGYPERALETLLTETAKNSYTVSGNNFQRGRDDLPLYLPGNGSLLFALAMMLKGYGENRGACGFPGNGLWDGIVVEGVRGLPW